MKKFQDFIFECYFNKFVFFLFEGKYSDEHAFRKVWNHFITHRRYGKEVRDLINSGKYDEAREAMEREIAAAKEDPKHPLSFEKAKRGFEKGKENNPNLSQSTYYDELKLAPDSVVAYTKGRRGKSATNRPTAYAKVEGGATPPTTKMWKDIVGKEYDTSKRDISIADTKDKKFGQGISLKQGEGSQTLSAEPEEVRGLFQAAAKKYIQQLKRNGATIEEIEKFERDIEYNISKYIRAQNLKISPTENKEKSNKRLLIAQSAVDSLVKNYPGFDKLVDKEAASGEQKFGKKVSAQLNPESQEFKDALTALRIKTGKVKKSDLTGDEKKRVSKILSKYKTYSELSDLIKSSPSGEAREVVRGTYVDPKTGEVISRAKAEPVSQRGELDQPLAARSGKGKSTKRETGFIEFEKRRRGEEPERIPRSGALAGRVGPAEPDANKKSNQAQPQQGPITLQTFERRNRIAELKAKREAEAQAQQELEAQAQQELEAQAQQELEAQAQHTQTAAELEKEVDKQNKKVSKVEQEVSQASVPINPETGEAILRQYRKNVEAHMASDPTSPTATVNNQRRQSANDKLNVAISNRDAAVSNQQTHLSTPPTPIQTQPTQPSQPSQPTPEQQPVQTQPSQPAPVQTQPTPEQQPVQTQPTQPEPEQQPVKSKVQQEPYKPNAIDRDGDGLVQDGTPHERPAQPTQEPKKKKNTGEKMAAAYDKKVDELVKT
jgi:hypothetical protein